jgi:alpha-beta hydrolase superfamily lysophospholipase
MVPPVTTKEPDGEAAGTVLIVHGLAEHRGRYAYVQQKLADAGYVSHAIDLRGHGEADGFPGKIDSPDELIDDVEAGVALVGSTAGPLFRVVLSACPISPGQATLDALADPEAPGIPPEMVSRDPEVVRAYAEDPLVFNANVPPECTAAVMLVSQRAYAAASAVNVPALLLHGGDDPIADASGSQDLLEVLASADKGLKVYDGLFHEVFNEPERDQVLGDVVAWLDAHR